MTDEETRARIREVLAEADEALSASGIQRRLTKRSRDVTTRVIREVCEELFEEGAAEATDDLLTEYRLLEA
jgi:repressor of nif and glnA expression